MIDNIPVLDGEIVVRDYQCITMDYRPRTSKIGIGEREKLSKSKVVNATLTVTNKRVIYRSQRNVAMSRGTSYYHQVNITDVGDISIVDSKWRTYTILLLSIIGAILTVSTVVLPILFLVFGIAYTFLFAKTLIFISIGSKNSSSGIFIGNVGCDNSRNIKFLVKPGKDFDTLSRELGTLVLDLQQNGDKCLYRWLGVITSDDDELA